MESYNHTYHRSIKRPQSEVNDSNEVDMWLEVYDPKTKENSSKESLQVSSWTLHLYFAFKRHIRRRTQLYDGQKRYLKLANEQ